MSDTTERIALIKREAAEATAAAQTTEALEAVRVRFLGRRAELPNLLRRVAELAPEQRAITGKAANEARQEIERAIQRRQEELAVAELQARLREDRIDVTLGGDPLPALGRLHLLTQTWREIEEIFVGLGFNVAEGPQVETVYYINDTPNTAVTHPSRARTDTFYVTDEVVLRTQTSPVQIRAMEAQPPPIYVIAPGRTYRPDSDPTHTPQFHQVEGLAVDTDVTLADLKGTLQAFARAIFGPEREIRMRPSFFPFTEPSVEVDVSCFNCVGGLTAAGERCPICKGNAWLELLGAGMVDPNVFGYVREHGYDPEQVQGFAFGMGIDRVAMLKHGVPDLRLLFQNDVRFLEQFV